MEGLYNMWKWVIDWDLKNPRSTNSKLTTIQSNKNEFADYLNSLKNNIWKSIRQNPANY
jgi:hypothetical protein